MRKEKRRYLVSGTIEDSGDTVREYVWAWSKMQATRLVCERIADKRKKHSLPPIKIYLIDREVAEVPFSARAPQDTKSPDRVEAKPNKAQRGRQKQLSLAFS